MCSNRFFFRQIHTHAHTKKETKNEGEKKGGRGRGETSCYLKIFKNDNECVLAYLFTSGFLV